MRRALSLLAVLLGAAVPSESATSVESFVLPGVDMRTAEFEVGRWCRYRVVDEADGVSDTSVVYVAILERIPSGTDALYWMELETSVPGGGAEERQLTHVLLSSSVTRFAAGDSLYHYIRTVYIGKGFAPMEPADPRDFRRLTLTSPTTDDEWARTPGIELATSAGSLLCERKDLTIEDRREIPTGRVTIVKHSVDRYSVWSSNRVPVFHLAKCVIERERETRTTPEVQGIPVAGVRMSRTTTMLMEFGEGAKALAPVNPRGKGPRP